MTSTDPRGPERTIVAVKHTTSVALVTLSCGHVSNCNQIYTYKIGGRHRCLRCLEPAEEKPDVLLALKEACEQVNRPAASLPSSLASLLTEATAGDLGLVVERLVRSALQTPAPAELDSGDVAALLVECREPRIMCTDCGELHRTRRECPRHGGRRPARFPSGPLPVSMAIAASLVVDKFELMLVAYRLALRLLGAPRDAEGPVVERAADVVGAVLDQVNRNLGTVAPTRARRAALRFADDRLARLLGEVTP